MDASRPLFSCVFTPVITELLAQTGISLPETTYCGQGMFPRPPGAPVWVDGGVDKS